MSDLAGQIDIQLHRDANAIAVQIHSTRPVTAARVFAGKPVADAARRLPMLFSICATAQADACASASEQALELGTTRAARRLRDLLLRAETVKEHLWRLLLDWPRVLDIPADQPAMAAAMRAYLRLRTTLSAGGDPFAPGADPDWIDLDRALPEAIELATRATAAVFGMPATEWLARCQDHAGLLDWAGRGDRAPGRAVNQLTRLRIGALGRNPVPSLPKLPLAALSERLAGPDADAFVAAPRWAGLAHETSPFARHREQTLVAALAAGLGNGLMPRLAALLVELARCITALQRPPRAGAADAASPDTGVGIAATQAARGMLVHRVEVADGRVRDYRILAPTEWNFHPRGVVAIGLARLRPDLDATAIEHDAALFINAVDPCVDYRIRVS